jgi:hypothetical protein
MNKPLKPWRCKSRILPVGPCPYACEVETPFEPRACLNIFVAEEWEPGEGFLAVDLCPSCWQGYVPIDPEKPQEVKRGG